MAQLGDIHPDGFRLTVTRNVANITFTLTDPHPTEDSTEKPTDVVTVRLLIEGAKVLSISLADAIAGRERELGPVEIPEEAQELLRQAREG